MRYRRPPKKTAIADAKYQPERRGVSGGAARVGDPDAILARAAGTLDFTQPITVRTHTAVTRFFDGQEPLEPGVVPVNL